MTIKCDICGRFIGHKELDSGKAVRGMISPDSAFTTEDYMATCGACLELEKQ